VIARSAAEVEAAMDQMVAPHLTGWARSIERNAGRHEGIAQT
jgi:hypothetical protein